VGAAKPWCIGHAISRASSKSRLHALHASGLVLRMVTYSFFVGQFEEQPPKAGMAIMMVVCYFPRWPETASSLSGSCTGFFAFLARTRLHVIMRVRQRACAQVSVCVRLCVCVCVCVCARAHACMRVRAFVHACVRMGGWLRARAHVCTGTDLSVPTTLGPIAINAGLSSKEDKSSVSGSHVV
jgi:hypothetical protein